MAVTAALILAGGGGRRLGGADKALLDIGGRPIIDRIVASLAPLPIAISANGDPDRFAAWRLPVLPDGDLAGQGPLVGVLVGLQWAAGIGADALLTVPGDTPFIPRDLARSLAPPPACAASNGRAHHLVALWPVDCRRDIRRLLSTTGRREVVHFARQIGMRWVEFAAAEWDPFLNVNTPEDLAVARAIVEERT